MPPEPTQMAQHASMAHFLDAFEGFRPPTGPFDPAGAWEHTYQIVMAVGSVTPQGTAKLTRTPLDASTSRLRVEYHKRCPNGAQLCTAEIVCRTDALSTPVSWSLETSLQDAQGGPIEGSRLLSTGTVSGEVLNVRSGDRERTIPLPGPCALEWCLFDAMQRLPDTTGGPVAFTLVDRLNHQVKPDQRLRLREEAVVELGGRQVWDEKEEQLPVGTLYRPVKRREGAVPTRLRAYEDVGRGVLPTVYWVDERGELLFVLSGLVGYIHTGAGGG